MIFNMDDVAVYKKFVDFRIDYVGITVSTYDMQQLVYHSNEIGNVQFQEACAATELFLEGKI